MAFVIETLPEQPLILVRMTEPITRHDIIDLFVSLRNILAKCKTQTSVYIGIDLNELPLYADVPLVQLLSHFAMLNQVWSRKLHLEFLFVMKNPLIPLARYLAKSLLIPIHIFVHYPALQSYVKRQDEIDKANRDNSELQSDWPK